VWSNGLRCERTASPCRRLGRHVIEWPAVWLFGLPNCPLALHIVDWQCCRFTRRVVNSRSPCRQFARRVVNSLDASSIRSLCCLAVLSNGLLGCRLSRCAIETRRVVVQPFAVVRVAIGVRKVVSGGKRGVKGKNEPRPEVVVRPCDAPPGPPISWVPLCILLPPSPFACSSIERDGDRPTSLRTGEGHWMCFSSVVGSEVGWRNPPSNENVLAHSVRGWSELERQGGWW
jgi:hypothetical protein